MAFLRVLYWFLAGGLMGFGLLAILSIGIPFLALGVLLAVVGAYWLGSSGVWAGLVGLGGVPVAILLWDVLAVPWACTTPGSGEVSPTTTYFSCIDTPVGPLTPYHVLAAGFGAIALVGLAWPLVRRLRGQANHAATA